MYWITILHSKAFTKSGVGYHVCDILINNIVCSLVIFHPTSHQYSTPEILDGDVDFKCYVCLNRPISIPIPSPPFFISATQALLLRIKLRA